MSSLSSGKLEDIKYLYENVVSSKQEVLGEDIKNPFGGSLAGAISRGSTDQGKSQNRAAVGNALGGINSGAANLIKTGGLAGAANRQITAARNAVQGNPSAPASTDYKSKFARPQNAKPGISDVRGGQGNVKPAKTAPAASGTPATTAPASSSARPVLSKQGGVEGTGTGANFKAGAWSSADKSRYSAQAAKTTPAASAQNQFAKANPNLAAAAAERARTRGTQQTDNPMMKDMKSSLPMNSPSVQAPAVAKLGAGNQSLSQNANAFKAASPKPATTAASSAATPGVGQRAAAMPSMGSSQYRATTPSAAIAAAPSTSPAASGSVVPATNKIAAMKQQPTMAPSGGAKPRPEPLFQSYDYEDTYDVVLEYLLDTGHAESIAEAQYIMTEMDQESIAEIAESQKPLPRNKMWNQIMNKPNKTGENLYSKNNRKMHSVIKAHDADPEGEAAKAKEKSKYKG